MNAQTAGKYYPVSRVVDGDTFVILVDKDKVKIRFIGIDAPESRKAGIRKQVQAFGAESKIFLTKYLSQKKVRLEFDVQKLDRYGRTLAYVYLKDGTFVNNDLVQRGYAKVSTFPPNVKHVAVFRKSEERARKKKSGLWK